jgi:hypothetical protein
MAEQVDVEVLIPWDFGSKAIGIGVLFGCMDLG